MTRGLQIDTGIVKRLFHLRSKGRSYQQIAVFLFNWIKKKNMDTGPHQVGGCQFAL